MPARTPLTLSLDLAVDFDTDLIGADRQTGMEVVAFFLGLDLVVALDVLPLDHDERVFERLAILAGDFARNRADLGERHTAEQQKSKGQRAVRIIFKYIIHSLV